MINQVIIKDLIQRRASDSYLSALRGAKGEVGALRQAPALKATPWTGGLVVLLHGRLDRWLDFLLLVD